MSSLLPHQNRVAKGITSFRYVESITVNNLHHRCKYLFKILSFLYCVINYFVDDYEISGCLDFYDIHLQHMGFVSHTLTGFMAAPEMNFKKRDEVFIRDLGMPRGEKRISLKCTVSRDMRHIFTADI